MMTRSASHSMPSVFVSHGAPTLALEANQTTAFFQALAARLPRPSAIVVFSAHFDVDGDVRILGAAQPQTVHDFFGFPEPLYRLNYPAPGKPALAQSIALHLQNQGVAARVDHERGIDHGAWVPLRWIYPEANIPVLQISVNSRQSPKAHYDLGRRLAHLREEGVLFIGSGGISHNLQQVFTRSPDPAGPKKVAVFTEWVHECLMLGELEKLSHYRETAPEAQFNHPTPEHFLPLFCALGAGGEGAKARRLHHATMYDVLAMDAYGFDFA